MKKTIICAVDLSAASKESLPLAAKLAHKTGAKLLIVHVAPNRYWSMNAVIINDRQKEMAETAQKAEAFVRQALNQAPEVEWELKVTSGEFSDIMWDLTRHSGAELTLSARRRGRLEVLKPSTAQIPAAEGFKVYEPIFVGRPIIAAA